MNFSDQQSTSNDQGTQFSGLREENNSPLDTSTAGLSGGNTQLKAAESHLVPVASTSQRPFSIDLKMVRLPEFLSRFSFSLRSQCVLLFSFFLSFFCFADKKSASF
jgi:hypothetical protein